MRTCSFRYTKPRDLTEAIQALDAGGAILAGGQSLVPLMKVRAAAPDHLVDINGLSELRGIRVRPDRGVSIGALTRHREVAGSPVIRQLVPHLATAASLIGDVQVRNRGTIGGSLCFADPKANYAPVLISLGAHATLRGPKGERVVPVEDLFVAPFQNSVARNEILASVEVPALGDGTWGDYREVTVQPGGLRLVNVGVTVRGDPVDFVGIGVGGLAQTPVRLGPVESALRGHRASRDVLRRAIEEIDERRLRLLDDLDAPGRYRLAVAKVLVRRMLLREPT